MTFKFKGVNLNEVVQSGGTQFGNFSGLTYSPADNANANSRPLATGYQYNGIDLANKALAPLSSIYTAPGEVTIPNGAKAFRFIGVGGGGGAGGNGGPATHFGGIDSTSIGGVGGNGGSGGWVTTGVVHINDQSINDQPIKVTIGAGGGGGGGGAEDEAPSSRSGAAQGTPGTPGTPGGHTFYTMGNNGLIGYGGNGGGGGGGGRTNSGQSGNVAGGANGANGNSGYNPAKPNDWTYSPSIPTGGNRSDYHYSNVPGGTGNSGSPGSAQFVWLYD